MYRIKWFFLTLHKCNYSTSQLFIRKKMHNHEVDNKRDIEWTHILFLKNRIIQLQIYCLFIFISHWIYIEYTLFLHWYYIEYTLFLHWYHIEYTLKTHLFYIDIALNIHWINMVYTLISHCIYIEFFYYRFKRNSWSFR